MMTQAATLCTENVSEVICEGESGVLMHGPTFMANPLACAVSLASIELLQSYDWAKKVSDIERELKAHLCPLKQHPRVKGVRVLGAIGVVECTQDVQVAEIQKFFVKESVWIRPFRNLIYLMPPYIIANNELKKLCQAIVKSLDGDDHFKP